MERLKLLRRSLMVGITALGAEFIASKTLGQIPVALSEENPLLLEQRKISLQAYLESIQEKKALYTQIVANTDLFKGFKELPRERQLADFEMYFPILKAAEIKYGVPWYLLWLNHFAETECSRNEFPEKNGYVGAMQRNPRFYSEEYVAKAIADWEFLKLLPQRYLKKIGSQTNDYEEIFFAARKIAERAHGFIEQGTDFEEAMLKALDSYCSLENARKRKNYFPILKEKLIPYT